MILLRAYASIWDFVNHIFGTNFLSLPPQTYGFFMAIAFAVGLYLAKKELERKTNLGIFPNTTKIKLEGVGIVWQDIIFNSILGAFIGLKVLGIALNANAFKENAQEYILSFDGSMMGAILGGLAIGGYIAYDQYKRKVNPPTEVKVNTSIQHRLGDILIIAMIGGVFGSKIMDAFDNPASMSQFISHPISSLTSGLSILGGLWLVAILLILYARYHKIKILPFTDSLAPPFFIAYAIGRFGCQFAGDGCWGIVSTTLTQPAFIPDFLWGNRYPHNVNQDGLPIPNCVEEYCRILPEPHLPTPLYETLIVSFLFLILWKLRERLTYHFGAITGLFLIFNGLERFFIEFIRVNTKYNYLGLNLSQAQYISLVMILMGLGLFIWSMRYKSSQSIPN